MLPLHLHPLESGDLLPYRLLMPHDNLWNNQITLNVRIFFSYKKLFSVDVVIAN